MNGKNKQGKQKQTVEMVLSRVNRPKKAVVTAGMPYANGPLHLGHLAGAHIPADICARWMKMLIGEENVLFVCGTDDHGSTSEVTALKEGVSIQDFIAGVHVKQKKTLDRYSINLDTYSGTSTPDTFPHQKELCQNVLRKLYVNEMLDKRTSNQWFDTELERFLPDRYVRGTCPNPNCDNKQAYSNECEKCGKQYESNELQDPVSAFSDGVPVIKATDHWWLDMWKVSDYLREWIQSKKRSWRKGVYNEVINTVLPCFSFANTHEPAFKEIKGDLPKCKSRYAPGKRIVVQFESLADYNIGLTALKEKGIECTPQDGWAYRSITRDVTWGVPLPLDLDSTMTGKSLYVWPDSLLAPISFTKVALEQKEQDMEKYKEYWCDPEARICQFLGQDNVFFYVLMQGALWLGSQENPLRLPKKGELQLSDIFGCFHLHVDGEKMSKSTGNFFTGDQLIDEKGYHPDQIRYFLALLSLSEKSSNFEFTTLDERNKFLAGPLNAAFEKPLSAAIKKFDGKIPEGNLLEKAEVETVKIVQRYVRSMEIAEYSKLLYAIENYARLINSFFTQFKPHDDRYPLEQRQDALYSCFYILKHLLIMLSPFVPETMNKLRESLNLPESILSVDEFGKPIPAGHVLNEKQEYFPSVEKED